MAASRRTFLKTTLASASLAFGGPEMAGTPPKQSENSGSIAANLAKLVGDVRIGTEFYLNRGATEASVRKHFRLMHSYGFTVARAFIIWNDIEQAPDVWNFKGYDWIYDAAHEWDIKIAATLTPEDPPLWMALTPYVHHHVDLNNRQLRERAAEYLQRVVGRYRNHPAQGIWLLMNEPHPKDFYGPSAMAAFGRWLEAKYGSVEKLNQRWVRPLKQFSDVRISPDQWDSYWVDYFSFVDWHEFNDDNVVEILRWVKAEVRKLDQVHPTHINPTGGNRWKSGSVVDFVGASIHPAWLFNDFPRRQFGLAFAYFIDLLAATAGVKPWWITELQGGPTIYTGRRAMNPTRSELRLWIWDAFGAGCKGVVFWLWAPTVLGREAGQWQLVSPEGVPSNRPAVAKSVVDSAGRMSFLVEAKPQPPKTAILYNRETLLLLEIDGRPLERTREASLSLMGCYKALRQRHVPVTFIDVDELKSGRAADFEILYAPYSYAVDNQAVSALREFVRSGGTLWADGLLAWKDEYGVIRPDLPGGLSEVFGWTSYVADVDPVEAAYSVTAAGEKGGELWKIPLKLHDARAIITDPSGQAFATENAFGKGRATYYGAAVTLAYFRREHPRVQEWIVAPAVEAEARSLVELLKAPAQVGFRALHHPSGPAVVLTNWGNDAEIEIRFGGEYKTVTNILANSPVKLARHGQETYATLHLAARQPCVVKATNDKQTRNMGEKAVAWSS